MIYVENEGVYVKPLVNINHLNQICSVLLYHAANVLCCVRKVLTCLMLDDKYEI